MANETQPRFVDVAADAGITYRQADYWARCGYINAPARGSGYPRIIDDHESAVLNTMARLVNAGIEASLAARFARSHVEQGHAAAGVTYTLADGIYLIVIPPGSGGEPECSCAVFVADPDCAVHPWSPFRQMVLRWLNAPYQLTTGAEIPCTCPYVGQTWHEGPMCHQEPDPDCRRHGHMFRDAPPIPPCTCTYTSWPYAKHPMAAAMRSRVFVIDPCCLHHGDEWNAYAVGDGSDAWFVPGRPVETANTGGLI